MRMRSTTSSHFKLAEELEHTSKVGDHYSRAEMLLPRQDEMARGHVVVHSHDASGNVISRAHANSILDIRCTK